MKANILMKIAVVFMAAFGAYAFSGNNENELKPFSIKEGGICTNILAACSENSQGPICMVFYNDKSTEVLDLSCIQPVRHDDGDYVEK